jgi:penicillin-binding protein 2
VVFENTVEVLNKMAISNEAYEAYTTGMEMAAAESGGTAYSTFRNYPVKVAAKTGTAQTGVTSHSDNGAFVCYAPADDPQIAVVVYGERAGHGRSLGDVAREVLDAYFGFGQYGDITVPENGVS